MTFVTPLLLAGAGLIVVPIILHLIMRQQPKRLIFPALRLVRNREDANRRKLRLRRWLLLLLRCAAIALLALALARPSLQASKMLADQEAPVAAALVFDTSPRMQYVHQNQTRLDVAKETAAWLLTQLPPESAAAVVDLGGNPPVFSVDLAAAKQRIERLAATPSARPLLETLEESLLLLRDDDHPRKEVYVFTDLAQYAWSGDAASLQRRLKELEDAGVYVVDVGVEEPRNFGLGDLQLSATTLPPRGSLQLTAELTRIGPPEERSVGLYMLDQNLQPQKKDQQILRSDDASQLIDFRLSGLPEGMNQGFIKIEGADGLAADDIRYFTVDVAPPARLLILVPEDATDSASILTAALAPLGPRSSRFECEVVSLDKLSQQTLEEYAAVCMLDPRPLEPAQWQQLEAYVQQGGGLVMALGNRAQPKEKFNDAAALALLPGPLKRLWRNQETHLAPQHLDHPVLAQFRDEESVPWSFDGVYKFWQLELPEDASVVVPYQNKQAAVVEKVVGRGRTLTVTTSLLDSDIFASDPEAWNVLLTGPAQTPFFTLLNEMFEYLVGHERLNYWVGETATLNVPEANAEDVFTLRTPRDEELQLSPDPKTRGLSVSATDAPGPYRLVAGGEQGVRLGFSVNLPGEAARLDRITGEQLAAAFGDVKHRVAKGREELVREQGLSRVGRELYSYLIYLVAIVLALEHLMASRFYKSEPTAKARPGEKTGRREASLAGAV